MVVTVATFEQHLAFLRRHFDMVPLGTLAADPPMGHERRPRCAITFDDGWRDNYELAFPMLRRHGIPATIFLTTDFIGTHRAFWHTELIYLLLSADLSRFFSDARALAAYPRPVREGLRRCAGRGRVASAHDTDTIVETIKTACEEDRVRDLLDTLTRAARLHRPLMPGRRFFLDWTQVSEMAAGGFEIGSHGCSHRIMTRLPMQEARRELVQSKAEIEARVGRSVEHFAFPNEDANPALMALAARAGYRTACVGGGAPQAQRGGIRALRRVGMHEGVSTSSGEHDDALLGLTLLRAPRSRPA
jgi:peptidoglycan/xylan/chitin deacetylase (PgdA/CDA1 family)